MCNRIGSTSTSRAGDLGSQDRGWTAGRAALGPVGPRPDDVLDLVGAGPGWTISGVALGFEAGRPGGPSRANVYLVPG